METYLECTDCGHEFYLDNNELLDFSGECPDCQCTEIAIYQ